PDRTDDQGHGEERNHDESDRSDPRSRQQNGEEIAQQTNGDARSEEQDALRRGAVRRGKKLAGPEAVKRLRADSACNTPRHGEHNERNRAGRREDERQPASDPEYRADRVQHASRHAIGELHETEVGADDRARPHEHLQEVLFDDAFDTRGRVYARHEDARLARNDAPEAVHAKEEEERLEVYALREEPAKSR